MPEHAEEPSDQLTRLLAQTRDAEAFIRQSQHLYATGSRAPKPVTPTVASRELVARVVLPRKVLSNPFPLLENPVARSFYFTQVIPELNARERAFCDRYFSSCPPSFPPSLSPAVLDLTYQNIPKQTSPSSTTLRSPSQFPRLRGSRTLTARARSTPCA